MYWAPLKLIRFFRKISRRSELEELFRDDFEEYVLSSGEFKGIRFTRTSDGKYADERLEATWKSWVDHEINMSMVI